MKNRGFAIIGIIIALVVVAILTLLILQSTGVQKPETTDAPVQRAKQLNCRMKIKKIKDNIRLYRMEHNESPRSLDDITSDYSCPVSGVEYEYNSKNGQVWCPDHRTK